MQRIDHVVYQIEIVLSKDVQTLYTSNFPSVARIKNSTVSTIIFT
jgi:hypothetical protein